MTALLEYLDLYKFKPRKIESMAVVLSRAGAYGDMVPFMVLDHFSATEVYSTAV